LLYLTCQTVIIRSMKYNEFLRLSKKKGWRLLRQGKGNHEILEKENKKVSIPNHGAKEMGL